MLTKKKQSLWARMALTLLLAMAGMVAMAQTFVVVDKQGNKITYDASKIDKVTFQEDPPGFTVHEVKEESSGTEDSGTGGPGTGQGQEGSIVKETTFAFAEVASFSIPTSSLHILTQCMWMVRVKTSSSSFVPT